MTPIRDLLNRIRWDAEFGRGDFELGVYDRIDKTEKRFRFETLRFPPEERRGFRVSLEGEPERRIPFHRVRSVYKNGELIWRRSTDEPG